MNEDMIKDFCMYLIIEKGLSQKTCQAYENDLNQFNKYIQKPFKKLNKEDILKYLNHCDKHYVTKSIQRKIVTLRQFIFFLFREKQIEENFMENFDLPKLEKTLPRSISIDEVYSIINQIDTDSKTGYRDFTMINLLANTGMRISELVQLKQTDLYLSQLQIKVLGKGSKERLVLIDNQTKQILHTYLKDIYPQFPQKKNGYIFVNNHGNVLTRENFYAILKKYATNAGIQDVSPHKLRHMFATLMLENHADVRSIQEILGHSQIDTTMIYTHVAKNKLMDDYMHFHPGNKRKEE